MSYTLNGSFIEACDCFIVCPCWVDEEADDGHCTGLVAWTLGAGSTIDTTPVHDRKVVSVTAHGSRRRGGTSSTVVFVDHQATPTQARLLAEAFAGTLDGPLGELAEVSGRVVLTGQAVIEIEPDDGNAWAVTVRLPPDQPVTHAVDVSGTPKVFPDNGSRPMSLRNTALSTEFGVPSTDPDVTSLRSEHLKVAVAALPGGFVDVVGRSGMTGTFSYVHPKEQLEVGDAERRNRE
jgi:hypothetical protein